MRRTFGFLIGVFVGWTVGSTIALLMAPSSGENLRGQLRARTSNFTDQIKSAAEMRRMQLEEELAAMRAPRIAARSE
jgi:gas vesicle protein